MKVSNKFTYQTSTFEQRFVYSSLEVVKTGNGPRPYFTCHSVRQDHNLSPLLFTIFVKNLKAYLEKNCNGLNFLSYSLESNLEADEEILALLYADEPNIYKESEDYLQKTLNAAYRYAVILMSE